MQPGCVTRSTHNLVTALGRSPGCEPRVLRSCGAGFAFWGCKRGEGKMCLYWLICITLRHLLALTLVLASVEYDCIFFAYSWCNNKDSITASIIFPDSIPLFFSWESIDVYPCHMSPESYLTFRYSLPDAHQSSPLDMWLKNETALLSLMAVHTTCFLNLSTLEVFLRGYFFLGFIWFPWTWFSQV